MATDQFLEDFMKAMMKPIPQEGDRVLVNGRLGTLLEDQPSNMTCAIYHKVLFDDGVEQIIVLHDFDPNKPTFEVVTDES